MKFQINILALLAVLVIFWGCSKELRVISEDSGGSITNINCDKAVLSGPVNAGKEASGIDLSVPYSGGNGGEYTEQTVTSESVTGLTAKLPAGTLSTGDGILTYAMNGVASDSGLASFRLSLGGSECQVNVQVNGSVLPVADTTWVEFGLSGGTIALPEVGQVTFPSGTFSAATKVYLTTTESEVTKNTFGLTKELYDISQSSSYFVRIGVEQIASDKEVQIRLKVPQEILQALGPDESIGLFGLLDQTVDADEELMNFEPVASVYNASTGEITASVPSYFFSNSLERSPDFVATVNIGTYNGVTTQVFNYVDSVCLSCPLSSCNVTSPFGKFRLHPIWNVIRPHKGTDLAASVGTPVKSSFKGVVLVAKTQKDTAGNVTGWGKYIILTHQYKGVKFHTLYAHLSGFNVTAGAMVEEGALIGFSGNTGTGSGPHLHWEFITPLFKTMTINDSPRRDPMNAICSECGAFVGSGVWKEFQCYNLGAANTSADPFTPSWEIMGGYWQWGRKNMAAPGPSAGDPNAGSIGGWNTTYAANGSWSDGTKTANDPCPAGYRVPTRAQWDAVLSSNTLTNVGTWTSSSTNYSSGKRIGNKLFLPAAGDRGNYGGALYYRGYNGYYWSSAEHDSSDAWYLNFGSSNAGTSNFNRTNGKSVRCVAE